MDVEIRSLSPNLADDYVNFFDDEKHSDNKDEHKCYCVCWCSDDHRTDADNMSTPQKRRQVARRYVTEGTIKGYLAYHNSKVVGWCNANTKSDCFNCISWLMFMKNVDKTDSLQAAKIKSVFCFTIAPGMRRKGIATQLLNRVCTDAKHEGFDYVEAYPANKLKQIDDYEGHIEMYQKCGFFVHKELDDFFVVRKRL